MPLFGRNKEPRVTLTYKYGPSIAVVRTPTGPRPLQDVATEEWVSLAALAWWGYRHCDRGLVKFDAETGEMDYHPAEELAETLQGMPILELILDACEEYNPDMQVVVMAKVVFTRGFRSEPEALIATLTMPKGAMPPVAAWALVERNEELRQINASLRAKMGYR